MGISLCAAVYFAGFILVDLFGIEGRVPNASAHLNRVEIGLQGTAVAGFLYWFASLFDPKK